MDRVVHVEFDRGLVAAVDTAVRVLCEKGCTQQADGRRDHVEREAAQDAHDVAGRGQAGRSNETADLFSDLVILCDK